MPVWVDIIGTLSLGTLTFFEIRTIRRSSISGIPYLFFWPHPFYREATPNRRSGFFWLTLFGHAWGVMVLGAATLVFAAFLFGFG